MKGRNTSNRNSLMVERPGTTGRRGFEDHSLLFFLKGDEMQLYYKKPDFFSGLYGSLYYVDHPCYNRCTLFKIKDRGIAVVQQRYDPATKKTWWDAIDPWLADDIYLNKNFLSYFDLYAKPVEPDGSYKTVSVRQIMHSLRMRPLEKQAWETRF